MKTDWMDISVPLYNGMVCWPGDNGFHVERVVDIKKGAPCNVSVVTMGTHTGTHIDPPLHFLKNGKSLDKMPLEAVMGPARIIEIKDGKSIKSSELLQHKIKKGERILFKTLNSVKGWKTNRFLKEYVYISKEAAGFLAESGVMTVGIDYLSVGGFEIESKETHQALLKAGIWIIEGLNLLGVKPGRYELACLPLKIMDGDGAPARAVLKEI